MIYVKNLQVVFVLLDIGGVDMLLIVLLIVEFFNKED